MKNNKVLVNTIFIILSSLLLFFDIIVFSYLDYLKNIDNDKAAIIIADANRGVNSLYFSMDVPSYTFSDEEYEAVLDKINLVVDSNLKDNLLKQAEYALNYRNIFAKITLIYIEGRLDVNLSNDEYEDLLMSFEKLNDSDKKTFEDAINQIMKDKIEYDKIESIFINYFTSSDLKTVNSNVTQSDYNYLKKIVNNSSSSYIAKKYASSLKLIQNKINKDIENAWYILDVKYISQNNNQVYNGCEAASLLMALNYKGILSNKSLYSFASEMPKSESDPHEGFIYSIYDLSPKDVKHWIASDALARFGKSYYSGVVDITGSSLDTIKNEVLNGNPVVIYITNNNYGIAKYIEGQEAATNLHVNTVIGYNSLSKEFLLLDPWTYSGNPSGKVYVSESKLNNCYVSIGKMAVVVR